MKVERFSEPVAFQGDECEIRTPLCGEICHQLRRLELLAAVRDASHR